MPKAVAFTIAILVALSLSVPAHAADYPAKDSRYHSYPEMVSHIKAVAARNPGIVRLFSIGKSYRGRKLWAAEISDNPGTDEGEPEILFDGLHHAREHLSAEMSIYILDMLTNQYGKGTELGKRVTRLVNKRRIWIVFMVNPDGLQYDLTGSPYRSWRKNRQPSPGSSKIGTDINRNYAYRFGCCGGSSGKPSAWNYRGPSAWSTPEARAMRDFIRSRKFGGRQRIRTHITFHSSGELVLWPYGYTRADQPPDMTYLDLRAFRAMGRTMAGKSGYTAQQSSAMYPTDGDMIDWTYARQRIFSFTFELYPRGGGTPKHHYPPDEIIARETRRNREAVLYLIDRASCPYRALGTRKAKMNCGPLFDDLEIARGWRVDPEATDTATDGMWMRGDPGKDDLQLGSAVSGRSVLVTGRLRGHDVDGGRTTVRSRLFTVPRGKRATLKLRYWVGLTKGAAADDGFRVRLVDADGTRLATLLKVSGDGQKRVPTWKSLTKALPADFGGQRLAIELVAVDTAPGAIVEAGVDQVRVYTD